MGKREWIGLVVLAVTAAALIPVFDRGPGVWALFFLDFAAVSLLGALAWKAPRLWPVWMMVALGVGAAASLAFMLQPDVDLQTYRRAMLLTRLGAGRRCSSGCGRNKLHTLRFTFLADRHNPSR